MTSPVDELAEHWDPFKISPWGWSKTLQSLTLSSGLCWIVLDCPPSEMWTSSEVNLELFWQITQRTGNTLFAIFMPLCQVYCCFGKTEVLWSSKRPASVYPSVLNHYEMTKWVYTHIADRVKEKQFLPCDCSIFYLVLATREMNWLHHSIAESLRLCQHDVCEADTGFDCVSSVWIKWVPAVTLQLYRFCWPGVGCELSDPVRNLRWFRLKTMWAGCMLSGQIVILLSELIFGWRGKKKRASLHVM